MTRNRSISLQECAGETTKKQKENDKNYIYYLHVKIILRDEFGKLTSTSSVKELGKK